MFSEIPGHQNIKETLVASVKQAHIAHAQLFSGTPGGAGLALAIAYATFINCENKQENDSCGSCPSCVKSKKLIHPDLHFVFPINTTKSVTKDAMCSLFMKEWREFVLANPYSTVSEWGHFIGAENKQLNISADEGRNIIKTLSLKAFEGEYKIMIMWMAENMNTSAANAILKILEEPPYKTIFLLVTNSVDKMLTTILSRTQSIKIRPFKDEEIQGHLMGKYALDDKKAGQIAYLSDGNMQEAVKLISEIEEDHHAMFRDWMRVCYKKNNLQELIEWSENFHKMSKEVQKGIFQYGLNILHETLMCRYGGENVLRLKDEESSFVINFSKVLGLEQIESISKEFNEAYYHIERNANPKITFLDVSLTISSIFKLK